MINKFQISQKKWLIKSINNKIRKKKINTPKNQKMKKKNNVIGIDFFILLILIIIIKIISFIFK